MAPMLLQNCICRPEKGFENTKLLKLCLSLKRRNNYYMFTCNDVSLAVSERRQEKLVN